MVTLCMCLEILILIFLIPIITRSDVHERQLICSRCEVSGNTTRYLLKPNLHVECPAIRSHNNYCEIPYNSRWTCACCSKPSWYSRHSLIPLEIELQTLNGHSNFINVQSNRLEQPFQTVKKRSDEVYHVFHGENRYLRHLPTNLCEQKSLVVLNLYNNRISKLYRLSCLANLDIFNVRYNLLTYIQNTTFKGMERLRVLDISHNHIFHIEPFSFQQEKTHILLIDGSHNQLDKVDLTNSFLVKPYCGVSYANNNITRITNENKAELNTTILHGYQTRGFVNLDYNSFRSVPDPMLFGLETNSDYGMLGFGIYTITFRSNMFYCDCNVYPIVMAYHQVASHFTTGGKVCCHAPKHMTKYCIGVADKLQDRDLNQFICNSSSCIPGCKCYYQPHQDTFYIECAKANDLKYGREINFKEFRKQLGMTEVKEKFSKMQVHANFSNNSLTEFTVHTFLSNTSMLDLSHNYLSKIDPRVLLALRDDVVINLQGNSRIQNLPRVIQRFRSSQIKLSGLVLDCTCEDEMYKWLPKWLKADGENNRGLIFCSSNGLLLDAQDINRDILKCSNDSNFLHDLILYLSLMLTLALAIALTIIFRHDLYILYRKFKERKTSDSYSFKYDVYIVMNESNEKLVEWVMTKLSKYLENKGYRCFVPVRDLTFGALREDEIRKRIDQSKTYIVILTTEIDSWMQIELRSCWRKYKEQSSRRLIVIDFDFTEPSVLQNRYLRAIIRLGFSIDFVHKHRFYIELLKQIGAPTPPLCQHRVDQISNVKFSMRRIGDFRVSNV